MVKGEAVVHGCNPQAMPLRAMPEPLFAEPHDVAERIHLVAGIAAKHLDDVQLSTDPDATVGEALCVRHLDVIHGMPHTVPGQPLALEVHVALEMTEPPVQHGRCDALQCVVLDPATQPAVRQRLDAAARTVEWLGVPGNKLI